MAIKEEFKSTALAAYPEFNTELVREREAFYRSKLETIKRTVAPDANNAELDLFLTQCARHGLDPFAREIWCVKMQGRLSIFVGRDGFLKLAQQNRDFEGMISETICENDEFSYVPAEYVPVHKIPAPHKRGKIVGAYAVVTMKGRKPVTFIADLEEYDRSKHSDKTPWTTFKSAMIKKVAEANALKRGCGLSAFSFGEDDDRPIEAEFRHVINDGHEFDEAPPKKLDTSNLRQEPKDPDELVEFFGMTEQEQGDVYWRFTDSIEGQTFNTFLDECRERGDKTFADVNARAIGNSIVTFGGSGNVAFGYIPSRYPDNRFLKEECSERQVDAVDVLMTNRGIETVSTGDFVFEAILEAFGINLDSEAHERDSMAAYNLTIGFLLFATDEQFAAAVQRGEQMRDELRVRHEQEKAASASTPAPNAATPNTATPPTKSVTDGFNPDAVFADDQPNPAPAIGNRKSEIENPEPDPFANTAKDDLQLKSSEPPKSRFEALSKQFGWPLWEEYPEDCAKAYSAILGVKVTAYSALTDDQFETLARYVDETMRGIQPEPPVLKRIREEKAKAST